VGWIINNLYSLCCYLKYIGIVHHNISLDTVFIHPVKHGTSLPESVKTSKVADYRTDLDSVKRLGLELLGPEAPAPIVEFLTAASSSDAIDEYAGWLKVLQQIYGPKKFIEMKIKL